MARDNPDLPDFIEVFPDALSPDACAALVARFEASGQALPGRVATGVRPELKLSRDICLHGRPEWRDAEEQLNRAMFTGLLAYMRKYPYLLLAPLMFQWPDAATGAQRPMRPEDFADFDDKTLTDADQGGYPYWHCEQTQAGALLIAPTAFTHTHRGNRPLRRDKYIATSWVLYKRGEELFGAKK